VEDLGRLRVAVGVDVRLQRVWTHRRGTCLVRWSTRLRASKVARNSQAPRTLSNRYRKSRVSDTPRNRAPFRTKAPWPPSRLADGGDMARQAFWSGSPQTSPRWELKAIWIDLYELVQALNRVRPHLSLRDPW